MTFSCDEITWINNFFPTLGTSLNTFWPNRESQTFYLTLYNYFFRVPSNLFMKFIIIYVCPVTQQKQLKTWFKIWLEQFNI